MKILDRYITIAVMSGTGVALLVIVGLEIFFSVIDQIDDVGKGDYTMNRMLQYVLLISPRTMYELFPIAALLGSLVGLGMLAANSELVAMRASGMSIWRITRAVLQAGVMMLVVAVIVGEVIAPVTERYGQQLRATATQKDISFLGSRGLWVREGNYFINSRRVLAGRKLADLSVYEFDADRNLKVATHATHAEYRDGVWQLSSVHQSLFSPDSVEVRRFEHMIWPSLLTPDLLGVVVLEPKNMSVRDISQFIGYLEDNGLDSQPYRYAFWAHLMTPVAALVMLFISVPFVFGGLRSASIGARMFTGILVGFGFYLVSQFSSQVGQVYGINPLLMTFTPSLLFLLLGIYAMRRV